MRQMMISEFGDWLRTQTNRQRRPFQEETIQTYTAAALTLSAWMEAEAISGDFTACDTGMLNRFFSLPAPAWRAFITRINRAD
jgi:hypothetical protein